MTHLVFLMKIVLVGDKEVGKHQLVRDYPSQFEDAYFSQGFQPHLIDKKYQETDFRFQIWILNPREHFRSMRKPYYLDSHGSIIVLGINKRESIKNTLNWISEIWVSTAKDKPIVIIGNIDSNIKNSSFLNRDVEAKVIIFQQIKTLIDRENNPNLLIKYIENRIEDNKGFELALNYLASKYLERMKTENYN